MFNIKALSFTVAAILLPLLLKVNCYADNSAVITDLTVGAKAAVVIEPATGKVVFAQNADKQLPMASTTKIMTALIVLEQPDIDKQFVVDGDSIKVEGTSMGLRGGDTVTLRALAYGMLLSSGNDAANAAAVKISKTIPDFAKLMNLRAKEIGLNSTNFVTPSGLDAKGHYSTAYDMALLAGYALNNPDFLDICSAPKAIIGYGNPPYNRYLNNHNRLLKEYSGCIGVKTGFTDNAKRCLVSAAERDGVRLICVTLNCPDDWDVHKKLYDTAFSYVKLVPAEAQLPEISISVVGGTQQKVRAIPFEQPKTLSFGDKPLDFKLRYAADKFLYAPVKQGDMIGWIDVYSNDKKISRTSLVAAENIEIMPQQKKNGFFEKAADWIHNIFENKTNENR